MQSALFCFFTISLPALCQNLIQADYHQVIMWGLNNTFKNFYARFNSPQSDDLRDADIVVFSDLKWDYLLQRPHHVGKRLARQHRVLFVEEPTFIGTDEHPSFNLLEVKNNLTVLQPRLRPGNWQEELPNLIQQEMNNLKIGKNLIFWFYHPKFIDMLGKFSPRFIVYDCIQDFNLVNKFFSKNVNTEKDLLAAADIVFANSRGLYESKRLEHDNVYFVPNSVDRKHFEQAYQITTEVPFEVSRLGEKIVGYYGIIDERIDFELLAQVADHLPNLGFILVGPLKVSLDSLPSRKNIHYLGPKHYQLLPNYLKAIDIAMLPYVDSPRTRLMRPMKALEYMAALKPIVSTPLNDFETDYKDALVVVRDANQFAEAIVSYLSENKADRRRRIGVQQRIVQHASWRNTVSEMEEKISSTFENKHLRSALQSDESSYQSLRGNSILNIE